MKILVTGGAGFIGRHLVDSLQKNHKVTIYDNLSNSSKSEIEFLLEKGTKFVNEDVLDYQKLRKSCIGFDMVIHLAAKSDVKESIIHPEVTNEVNVTGTKNILNCCIQNKIKKLIFASSAAVYGDCNSVVNEKTKKKPLSPYGASKLLAEQEIVKFVSQNDLNAISLRMFNVYGGENNQLGVISKFIKNVSNGEPIVITGDGKQTRDFISIKDVVIAFDCAIKKIGDKKGNAYNIASGRSISIEELAKLVIGKSGKKIEIKHTKPIDGEIKNSFADITLALQELGFVVKHFLEDEIYEIFKNN